MKKFFIFFILLTIILLNGCDNSSIKYELKNNRNFTIEEAIKFYYTTAWKSDESILDIVIFINAHRDELLRTLEIVEVVTIREDELMLAFIRFSIGTVVARQYLLLHKVEETWTINSKYNLEYSLDRFGIKELDDNLKKLNKRAIEWGDDSSSEWWVSYI